MTRVQKPTTLYKTPFSKAYWHDAFLELKDTKMLVIAALMIALRVSMKWTVIPLAPNLNINVGAPLVNAMGAMIFGPVVAALAACVSDLLGFMLFPQGGTYFLPYMFVEVAGSVLFALFFYRAKVTVTRVILARFSMDLFVNIILNSLVSMWYYAVIMGKSYAFMILPAVIKNLCMFPIEAFILTLFLGVVIPITRRVKLTYGSAEDSGALKFEKKQLALLLGLFAVGVCCLCRKKGKKANIVIDLEQNSAQRLIDEIRAEPQYKDVFLSGQDALLMADNRSILVVVDTNRPDQVECKPLLEAISKVCVVDHHRRAADYISPVVVNLHETYASSASELVTEILLYAVEKKDVLPIEAKCLLAGICLDTKFFNVRTGERTFEAAAALRRMGADPTEVKRLLQNDFQDTMAKYQIIKSSRLYRQEIAIAALNTPTSRVLAAQAADELLNIYGITASFVLYPDGEQTIISARSIGRVNVQMILEPLGGGGNTATAGAQMKNINVKDALDKLVASIDKFYEE